jgi:hypothetical protein
VANNVVTDNTGSATSLGRRPRGSKYRADRYIYRSYQHGQVDVRKQWIQNCSWSFADHIKEHRQDYCLVIGGAGEGKCGYVALTLELIVTVSN